MLAKMLNKLILNKFKILINYNYPLVWSVSIGGLVTSFTDPGTLAESASQRSPGGQANFRSNSVMSKY